MNQGISPTRFCEIHLLGEFSLLSSNGNNITPKSVKACCLLVILSLSPTGKVSRDKIAKLLWGRHADEQARSSLRQCLRLLRSILDSVAPGTLTADRKHIQLHLDNIWIDAKALNEISPEALINLKEYQLLNKGEILEGLLINDSAFNDWLAAQRLQLKTNICTTHMPDANSTAVTANHYWSQRHDSKAVLYRKSLIKKVRKFWIEGVLNQSLLNNVYIELSLEEKNEHVQQPWKNIVQIPTINSNPQQSINMVELFHKQDQNLLILGTAGAGKTTMLLTLAKQLLQLAEENPSQAIPIVLHLATWDDSHTSFKCWLESEIQNRYQMPNKLSAELIENQGFIFLFDGLDEVDLRVRNTCIQALNEFHREHTELAIAICSRENDYSSLDDKLALYCAVAIQPISSEQLDTYIQDLKQYRPEVDYFLEKNKKYRDLMTTPLMLNISLVALSELSEDKVDAPKNSNDDKEHLFSAYVCEMLMRRKNVTHKTKEHTLRYLSWLAFTLKSNNHTIFYLDNAQPNWLVSDVQRLIVSKGSILVSALLTALPLALIGSLYVETHISFSISFSLAFLGAFFTALMGYADEIKPLRKIVFSWRALKHQFFRKILGSAVIAAIIFIAVVLVINGVVAFTLGSCFFMFLMLVNSLDHDMDESVASIYSSPMGAITNSLKISVISFFIASLLGASAGLLIGDDIPTAAYTGVLVAVVAGLFFGAHVYMQHYLLRFFFWLNRDAPWRYASFLDFSVERVFLYRIGSGYLFIHRDLLEYFYQQYKKNDSA